jgi:UDP-N-acetyl-D-mannosaminuronate dehydrogenase
VDCVVIATDHKMFRDLDIPQIKALMKEKPALVDSRRIVNPEKAKKLGFIYFGIGYKKTNKGNRR